MSWRRGFFRLWIVFAIIWIIGMGFYGNAEYQSAIRGWQTYTTVPIGCSKAKGVLGTDYGFTSIGPLPDDIYRFPPLPQSGFEAVCWVRLGKFKADYPEAKGNEDSAILAKAYAQTGAPDANLAMALFPSGWSYVWWTIAGMVIPPLIFLGIGWVIAWVLSGFRSRPDAPRR